MTYFFFFSFSLNRVVLLSLFRQVKLIFFFVRASGVIMTNVIITRCNQHITRTWHTDNDLKPRNGALCVYNTRRVSISYNQAKGCSMYDCACNIVNKHTMLMKAPPPFYSFFYFTLQHAVQPNQITVQSNHVSSKKRKKKRKKNICMHR